MRDDKFWEKLLKDWEGYGEMVENHLKELLTEELDENNKANIKGTIRMLCMCMTQKENYRICVQSNPLDGIKYLMNLDNSKKAEKEVREKFHVPDTIPIIFK